MKKTLLAITAIVSIGSLIIACNANKAEEPIKLVAGKYTPEMVKRGEYLVTIMLCNDCHTPKIPGASGMGFDSSRLLSGHPADEQIPQVDPEANKGWIYFNYGLTAIKGPWGTSFTRNLTSDTTGIGAWTEEQFKKALTQGKYKGLEGTRTLLPPMPWENFKNMKDEDVRDIFAYLKSTRPIKNVVPEPLPPGE